MKKLLLPLLITLSTTILAKTPDSLFGVYINDNVLDYVTKEELKSKGKDYARGFYYVEIKNPPVSNKDYSDILWVRLDKNNKISNIQSEKYFRNFKNCKKVEYGVKRQLERKYDIEFKRNSLAEYAFEQWVGDNRIATECKVHSDDKITLYTILETEVYANKYNEYYDSSI